MEMAFSRGLYTGWFHGVNNQELVHGRFGKKRGVYLGQVLAVRGDSVLVGLAGQLQPGDGIVFDAGRPGEPEQGGRVYQVETGSEARRALARETTAPRVNSAPVPGHTHESVGREAESTPPDLPPALLFFGTGDLDLRRVHPGDRLWKTSDPGLERSLRQSFEGEVPRFQRPVQIELHGRAGLPLSLIARDEDGIEVRMESAMPLAVAGKQPLSMGRLREQLGRLGGTPFKLGELNNYLEGDVLLPISELNRLRRDFVSRLLSLRAEPRGWRLVAGPLGVWECDGKSKSEPPVVSSAGVSVPQLLVLVRDLAQLDAALAAGVEIVYCDFEDPRKYREAVKRFRRETHRPTSSAIFVAPPRVSKPGEDWILNQVRSCEPDGYLVRNFDHLKFFQTGRRVGDYSLNVANRVAAGYFKTRFDLERITPSYDLNFAQLEALLRAAPPHWFEVTLHQHIPMFHMEHCVFCAFLSTGTNYTNCGRPCDTRELKLRDRVGAEHPVKADAGCRNTVFNALAQTGADYASRMIALGVRHFRLEFLNETPSVVAQTLDRYGQLLRGQISGPDLWRDLKLLNQLGVTRGQMGGAAAG
jgi:putative protease